MSIEIAVGHSLITECTALLPSDTTYRAEFKLIGAEGGGGAAGGFYLLVGNPHDSRADRHLYFSQSDRIRLGVLLLSGIPLPALSLILPGGRAAIIEPMVVPAKEGPA